MTGALYYRTTAPIGMKVYDGNQWIEASAAQQASLVTYEYVASAGQTTFSGADANGVTLSYTVGNVLVTLNGSRLRPGDEFTATNGTSIVLVTAASAGDELIVDALKTFDVANTYTQAQADARFIRNDVNEGIARSAGGNFGFGALPSAWGPNQRAIEFNDANAVISNLGGNKALTLTSNTYFDGASWRLKTNGTAQLYALDATDGQHSWYGSPSGTAGGSVAISKVLSTGLNQTLALQGAAPVSGAGVTFPATQSASSNANTLDDYEEGTWSITDNSGAGLTFSVVSYARYTKVGRLVFVEFDLDFPVNSNGNNSKISLPFPAQDYGSGMVGWSNNGVTVKIHLGVSGLYFMNTQVANGNTHITNQGLSGCRLIGSACFLQA